MAEPNITTVEQFAALYGQSEQDWISEQDWTIEQFAALYGQSEQDWTVLHQWRSLPNFNEELKAMLSHFLNW
ncbi:MAG: hypothetical protein AAGG51_04490 [Cyanobacteria bacterium P01_G01_bin.54]